MAPEPTTRIVLYVEDEEHDAFFMRRAFAQAGPGLDLRVVTDGRAAIKYLSDVSCHKDPEQCPVPALVLLDLNLPGVHGFEVLSWIRSRPEYTTTPVVVFSSSPNHEDHMRARTLRANEFVEKPHSALQFVDVVKRLRKTWLMMTGVE